MKALAKRYPRYGHLTLHETLKQEGQGERSAYIRQ